MALDLQELIRQTARGLEQKMRRRVACRVHNEIIDLEVGTELEKFRAETYATKEPETLEWIERYFRPGHVMFDVGANIGLYALYAAKFLKRQCRVYAFEPEALNFAQLSKHVFINQCSGVIIPCGFAICDRLRLETFHLNPHSFETICHGEMTPGTALHAFGKPVDHAGKSFRPHHVQKAFGASIDALWAEWGFEFPQHIKIDVDGLEEQVVAGAERTLRDARLRSVLVEISAKLGHLDPILRKMLASGFRQVTDFRAHSRDQLKGTPYEDSVNTVFIRG
ncbi:MAG: FkbM family methyltransferase [Verrucomicrobia bacterium]|nr:FkbM family methyltransferase [Verrucomicrobiota bacterium]